MPPITKENVDKIFSYHGENDKDIIDHHVAVRAATVKYCKELFKHCPAGTELSTALTDVQRAFHAATSAIALRNVGGKVHDTGSEINPLNRAWRSIKDQKEQNIRDRNNGKIPSRVTLED